MTLIETLLQAIDDIVAAEGTWKEKKEKIIAEASEDNRINLNEFVGWFDVEDVEGVE